MNAVRKDNSDYYNKAYPKRQIDFLDEFLTFNKDTLLLGVTECIGLDFSGGLTESMH